MSPIALTKLFSFLTGSSFTLPVLVLYYSEQIGLSFAQFMLCETLFVITMLVMEIPSGYISDIFKRKVSLLLHGIFFSGSLLVLYFADSFADALLSQFLAGIAVSFLSGTITAFTYDTALAEGKQDQARKIEGSRSAMTFYATAICATFGGFLYKINPNLPVALSFATCLLSTLIVIFMPEPKRHMEAPEKSIIGDIMSTVRYALHGHAEIARLILLGGVIFTVTKLTLWVQQPYYMKLGFDPAWFGLLMAGGMLLNGVSSHNGHFFDKFLGGRDGFYRLVMVQASLLALAAGNLFGTGVVFLLMAGGIFGLGFPCLQTSINNLVGSARRATTLSCATLVISLFQAFLSAPFGYLTDKIGVSEALFVVATSLLLFCMSLWLFDLRARRVKSITAPPADTANEAA